MRRPDHLASAPSTKPAHLRSHYALETARDSLWLTRALIWHGNCERDRQHRFTVSHSKWLVLGRMALLKPSRIVILYALLSTLCITPGIAAQDDYLNRVGPAPKLQPGEVNCWTYQAMLLVAIGEYKQQSGLPKVRVTPELQAKLVTDGLLLEQPTRCVQEHYHVARSADGRPALACKVHGNPEGSVVGSQPQLADRALERIKSGTRLAMADMACRAVCGQINGAITGHEILNPGRPITSLSPEVIQQLQQNGLLSVSLKEDPAGGGAGSLSNYALEGTGGPGSLRAVCKVHGGKNSTH